MKKVVVFLLSSAIMAIGLFSPVAAQGGLMGMFSGQGARPQDSSDEIAKKIIDSKKPVLIDFWAVWCGPCRMLNPTIKKLDEEYKGKVLFIKVNVDYNPRITSYFQVQGIPAVFIIRDRTVVQQFVGLRPEEDFRAALDAVLAMPPVKDSVKVADSVKAKGKKRP